MISKEKNTHKTNILEKKCSCIVIDQEENTICVFAIKAQEKDEAELEKIVHYFMEGCKSIKTLSTYKTLIREDDINSFEVDYAERVTSKKLNGTASYQLSLYLYNEKDKKRCLSMFRRLVSFIMQAERDEYNV